MITWNDLKHLDVKDIDLTKIDLTKIDLTKIDVARLRNIDFPKMPEFDLPSFDLPDFEVPADLERAADLARDAAYAGLGVAVIAVQKLDEQRRELTDQVTAQVRKLVDAVA